MIKILIVDDEILICEVLKDFFETKGFEIFTLHKGEDVLKIVEKEKPHLVFLDMNLPDKSGMELLPEIKKIDSTTKVIMITACSEEEKVIEAKNKGASDYIIKPFSLAYIQENIMYKVYEQLFEDLRSKHNKLTNIYEQTLFILAKVLEEKDRYTKGHSERVANYSVDIAKELKLPENYIRIIYQAGLLHDIGKIGIKNIILNKRDVLSNNEFDEIKKHTIIGFEILNILNNFKELSVIIRHHHERIDGKGYPDNKKGEEIPLSSRILAIADSYDAMTSNRPYRKGMAQVEAIKRLIMSKGTQLDTMLVNIFVNVLIKNKTVTSEDIKQLLYNDLVIQSLYYH
ncbi:MAG: hypothetical protein A2539_02805 [Elusimicrobia bacterium RIFOXYD2_FULL_34_15]|nr:MAG: hypothetical protein A2539_02805 [Elusimicrobia bacterium RIFOXYD2_FULL_34_15]